MKKLKSLKNLLLLLAVFASTSVAMAQDANPRVPFYIGEINYKAPNAFNTILGLSGALNLDHGGVVDTEDKTIVPAITNAIKTAGAGVYRLIVQEGNEPDGEISQECYVMDINLTNVMTGNGAHPSAQADVEFKLVNLLTGKTVEKRKYGCAADGMLCATVDEAIADLCTCVERRTRQFLWGNFPVSGLMLQKGVEQANGKVKEKQCYIDLGDKFNLYKNMPLLVYKDDNGKLKELGKLKYVEAEGDEIGVCKITKGDKKIAEALENNEKLVVKTNVNIKDNWNW